MLTFYSAGSAPSVMLIIQYTFGGCTRDLLVFLVWKAKDIESMELMRRRVLWQRCWPAEADLPLR